MVFLHLQLFVYNMFKTHLHVLSVMLPNFSPILLSFCGNCTIPERIQYKIALLTFKTLKFGLPSYLSDLLTLYHPGRTLRSSNLNLLSVPDIRSKIGRRSFSFSAPMVWNSLPCELRSLTCLASFRSRLKTHLFPP